MSTNGPVTSSISLTARSVANPKRVRVDADGSAIERGAGSTGSADRG